MDRDRRCSACSPPDCHSPGGLHHSQSADEKSPLGQGLQRVWVVSVQGWASWMLPSVRGQPVSPARPVSCLFGVP